MTPERIAELRAMCERATPGPWRPGLDSRVHAEGDEFDGLVGDFCDNKEPDIAFIAAARAALPECLDEIERLRKIIVEAPHHPACCRFSTGGCDCWEAAFAQPQESDFSAKELACTEQENAK